MLPRRMYSELLDLTPDGVTVARIIPSAAMTSIYTLTLPPTLPTISGSALVCDIGGQLSWSAGGGSTAWSALTDPIADLALTMDSYASTFTYGNATGTIDLFTIRDAPFNTGTGSLFVVSTNSGSSALTASFRARNQAALRIGHNVSTGVPSIIVGNTTSTHSTTYGLLSFGTGTDRSQAIVVDDSATTRAGIGAVTTGLRLFCTDTAGHTISLGSMTLPSGTYNQAASVDPAGNGGIHVHSGRRLRLYRPGDTQYVELRASVTAFGSYTITLPQTAPGIANSLMEFTASGTALFTVDPAVRTLRLNTSALGTAARLQINNSITTINNALAIMTPPNTATSALALQWAGTPVASPSILSIYRSDGSLWMGFRAGLTSDVGIQFGSAPNAPLIEANATTVIISRASGGFAPLQSGQHTVIGEAYISNVVTGLRPVTNATTDIVVVINQFTLNTLYTNNGATGEVILTLPAASVPIGSRYGAYVRDGQYLRFQAGAGTQIRMITGGTTVAGGYVRSNTVGSLVELIAVSGTEWVAMAQEGVWLVDV